MMSQEDARTGIVAGGGGELPNYLGCRLGSDVVRPILPQEHDCSRLGRGEVRNSGISFIFANWVRSFPRLRIELAKARHGREQGATGLAGQEVLQSSCYPSCRISHAPCNIPWRWSSFLFVSDILSAVHRH